MDKTKPQTAAEAEAALAAEAEQPEAEVVEAKPNGAIPNGEAEPKGAAAFGAFAPAVPNTAGNFLAWREGFKQGLTLGIRASGQPNAAELVAAAADIIRDHGGLSDKDKAQEYAYWTVDGLAAPEDVQEEARAIYDGAGETGERYAKLRATKTAQPKSAEVVALNPEGGSYPAALNWDWLADTPEESRREFLIECLEDIRAGNNLPDEMPLSDILDEYEAPEWVNALLASE